MLRSPEGKASSKAMKIPNFMENVAGLTLTALATFLGTHGILMILEWLDWI